jgi:hypothetical protein
MTRERKELIQEFEKLFATNPNPSITAAQCANIAENYAESKIKKLAIPVVKESALDAFDRGFTAGYNAGVKMGLNAD